MEPCPMCMGTLVMSGLRKLRTAARDGYCGAVNYRDFSRYIKSKNIDVVFEGGDTELVQLTMQIYYELGRIGESHSGKTVMECFAADRPQALRGNYTIIEFLIVMPVITRISAKFLI